MGTAAPQGLGIAAAGFSPPPIIERPVWLEDAELPAGEAGAPPGRVDVAIIGGGYTGLSAARTLARRGARVALFEAHALGWGASSRNGGQVLTGMKLGAAALVKRFGAEHARLLFNASLDAIACVEQIVAEEQIDCDFRRCGHLELAAKPGHFTGLEHEAEVLAHEFGHRVSLVPGVAQRSEIGSDAYYGALVDEASAGLHPARFVAGLAGAARRAGALLYDHAPVQRVARDKGGWLIATGKGPLWASELLAATSGYTGRATPALHRRVVPIGSYIIATEPLAEHVAHELLPHNRMAYDTKNFLYYFRLTPDRRMLFGGRAGFTPPNDATVRQSAAILRRGMLDVFPQLRDARVQFAWGGTLGFTFDIFPHAGILGGMHYAVGYAGHGVALATYIGARLADQICGDPHANPLSDLTLPRAPLGLYTGDPWFLPLAGLWYRFKDWMS